MAGYGRVGMENSKTVWPVEEAFVPNSPKPKDIKFTTI